MRSIKNLFLATAAVAALAVSAPAAKAQISLGVNIGAAPACPYGYYDYAPYRCAPYGYYGPSWFNGGVFIGAGPWFHGPAHFHGYVNRAYDGRYGYHGAYPARGEHWDGRGHDFHDFHGSHWTDGHGAYHEEHGHR
jgi:hypothetical protein